jgi:iron complex transport system substrate-binding protein
MKLAARTLSILMAMAIFLSACAPAATAVPTKVDTSVTVLDGAGKEFHLAAPAQRIISLAPSNTEILFAVGAGKQVIAREDFSNFPEEAAKLPSIGGNMGTYNLEEITKLQPDLILASPLTAPEALKSLLEITPNVFTVSNPKDLEGMYANLVTIGTLTGHKAEAETLSATLKARAQAVLDTVKGTAEKPKVFYELDATDPAKPWTAGPGTFIDLLIGLSGGKNIGATLTGDWAQISQEELIVQNPDIILLGDALYGGITPESVAARPGWKDIAAVSGERVLTINDDLVSRPGPRMIDGLETLAKAIHPELFN